MTPLATRGTFNVFVRAIGYSRNPDSATQARPVISPVPLRTNDPAGTFLCHTSSRGMTTVTPVRTGPTLGLNGPGHGCTGPDGKDQQRYGQTGYAVRPQGSIQHGEQ